MALFGRFPEPENATHHAINGVAAAAPVVSWVLQFPAAITVATSILVFVYYCILIGEKIFGWNWRKKK